MGVFIFVFMFVCLFVCLFLTIQQALCIITDVMVMLREGKIKALRSSWDLNPKSCEY